MAIGSPLLGNLTGSLGSVYIRRVNGQSVIQLRPVGTKVRKWTYAQMREHAIMHTVALLYNAFKPTILSLWQSSSTPDRIYKLWSNKAKKMLKQQATADKKYKVPFEDSQFRMALNQCSEVVPCGVQMSYGKFYNGLFVFDDDIQAYTCMTPKDGESLRDYLIRTNTTNGSFFTYYVVNVHNAQKAYVIRPDNRCYANYWSQCLVAGYKVVWPSNNILDLPAQFCYLNFFLEPADDNSPTYLLNNLITDPITISSFYDYVSILRPGGVGGLCCVHSDVKLKKHSTSTMHLIGREWFGAGWQAIEMSYQTGVSVIILG